MDNNFRGLFPSLWSCETEGGGRERIQLNWKFYMLHFCNEHLVEFKIQYGKSLYLIALAHYQRSSFRSWLGFKGRKKYLLNKQPTTESDYAGNALQTCSICSSSRYGSNMQSLLVLSQIGGSSKTRCYVNMQTMVSRCFVFFKKCGLFSLSSPLLVEQKMHMNRKNGTLGKCHMFWFRTLILEMLPVKLGGVGFEAERNLERTEEHIMEKLC